MQAVDRMGGNDSPLELRGTCYIEVGKAPTVAYIYVYHRCTTPYCIGIKEVQNIVNSPP
jgi:hypothetical protein